MYYLVQRSTVCLLQPETVTFAQSRNICRCESSWKLLFLMKAWEAVTALYPAVCYCGPHSRSLGPESEKERALCWKIKNPLGCNTKYVTRCKLKGKRKMQDEKYQHNLSWLYMMWGATTLSSEGVDLGRFCSCHGLRGQMLDFLVTEEARTW